MWRVISIFVAVMSSSFVSIAQKKGEVELIASFIGVSSEEEVTEDEVERLGWFIKHPLKINMLSRNRLVESGLFSSYQIASLIDYRRHHGDILSFNELAMVDGFGRHYVELLKPFVSLLSSSLPGSNVSDSLLIRNELSLRGGYRYAADKQDWQYGLKYGLDASPGLKVSFGLSRSRTAKTPAPSSYTASLSWDFRKIDLRLVAGDFNARFGQGLVAWNGAFISSLATPSGFMKKASGISAVRSFTGSTAKSGVAAEVGVGKMSLSAAVAVPGLKDVAGKSEKLGLAPVVNARWWTRIGTVGMTASAECLELGYRNGPQTFHAKSSVDAALCIKGVNVFGEAAYDWSKRKYGFVAGTDFALVESMRLAALTGWSQGQQWQWALSGEFAAGSNRKHKGIFSSEVIYYIVPKGDAGDSSVQVKSQFRWEWSAHEHFILRIRLSDRFRTWGLRHRTELRMESAIPFNSWLIDCRLHLLKCRASSVLGYVDASCKMPVISAHMRLGLFRVDHWDDRIYVYEYDAPGSFNVPAYYGRGVWTAGTLSWKVSRSVRLYLRASYIAYPFEQMQKKKPGSAELKIQSVFRF